MKVQIQMCNCERLLKKRSGKMQANPNSMINRIALSHSVMLIHRVLLLALH